MMVEVVKGRHDDEIIITVVIDFGAGFWQKIRRKKTYITNLIDAAEN